MSAGGLALLGGEPVRTRAWPAWPRATGKTLDRVLDVLESSRWALSGPYDGRVCYERRFAEAFARFHGVPFCTPTTNGTASLAIALQALGVGRDDEVLVPGITWVACASVVARLGATPVLVDVDPVTLTMSPERARAAVTPRTKAILLVHLYCSVADLDAFTELAAELDLALVEDCAQAHGARWRGRPVGTFGAVGCFSMQQSKLLTAGEGGAAITAREALHDRLEQLRSDGRRFAGEPAPGRLELVEVGEVGGANHCLSELQAAVLLEALERLRAENATRAQRAAHLLALLEDVEGVAPLPADPRVTTRTFYNLVLRLEPDAFAGSTVDAVARALTAELGSMVNPVYVPLHRHRLVRWLHLGHHELPEAERARRTCLTLTHPVLLDDDAGMEDVAAALRKVRRHAAELHRLPQEPSLLSF